MTGNDSDVFHPFCGANSFPAFYTGHQGWVKRKDGLMGIKIK